ncbi:hypothetical protein GTA08_BOTSDO09201 [Botryosphaeria dothidea]|uniref:Uncharacterized protein n=1 Tax=Botryosphaeria dothidea TaxID=55169 RepID=A0A8H4MXT2_9PEZI|nr:hypothetical protein GTA08_BOTSDO09201 [Botryosphaeria dothidea]
MSALLSYIHTMAGSLQSKAQNVLDSLFPPEKRAELFSRLQAFAVSNPKLSAFLLTNFALTGLPLIMFAVFTLTVFVFSLVAALLVALLVALLFTAFMVGVALLVILPTVFLTTMGASFLFLWGLGGYYILKWFNDGASPAASAPAIGDKLNSLTGGRLDFLMNDVRKQDAKKEGGQDSNGSTEKSGSPRKIASNDNSRSSTPQPADVGNAKNQVEKTVNADGVKKRVGNTTNTANNASSAVGGAKGAIGGATGLA